MQVLKICKDDTVLTLTSGGCNALNLVLHGAGRVLAVDCNPAQSALLELKTVAIRHAPDTAAFSGCYVECSKAPCHAPASPARAPLRA